MVQISASRAYIDLQQYPSQHVLELTVDKRSVIQRDQQSPAIKSCEADQSVQLSDVMISLAASYRDIESKEIAVLFFLKKLQSCGK
jgi:Tfp pilus assembly PilM family ATPase